MALENIFIVDSLPSGRETLEWALERAGATSITASAGDTPPADESTAASAQLAIVAVRTHDFRELGVVKQLSSARPRKVPVLVVGPESARDKAAHDGAALFLSTPLFVRDAINAARIMAAADGNATAAEFEVKVRLSLFEGLYQLVRALLCLQRSFIVELRAGRHRGELRFVSGLLSAAHLDSLQGTTALHRMLLWQDGDVVIRARNQVRRSGQFSSNPDSLILEADRFLRDFAHEAGDLGTARTVYQQDLTRVAQRAVHVPDEVSPVFRLFDGQRDLAAVVQDSPFPVFDTIRIVRRLVQAGALVLRATEGSGSPKARREDTTSGVMAIAGWNERPKDERAAPLLLEPKRRRKITASRLVVERPSSLMDGPTTPPPVPQAVVSGELRRKTPESTAPLRPTTPLSSSALSSRLAPPASLAPAPRGPAASPARATGNATGLTSPPARPTNESPPSSAAGGPAPPLVRNVTPLINPLPAVNRAAPKAPAIAPAIVNRARPTPLSTPLIPPTTDRATASSLGAAQGLGTRARTSANMAAVAGEIGQGNQSGGTGDVRSTAPKVTANGHVQDRPRDVRSGEIRAPLPRSSPAGKAGAAAEKGPSIVVDPAQMPAPAPLEARTVAPISMLEVHRAPAPPAGRPVTPAASQDRAATEGDAPPSASTSGIRRARNAAANAFSEVEADFFAREADLYRHQAVEDFADLDHPPGKRKP